MKNTHDIEQLMGELHMAWSRANGAEPAVTIDWGKYRELLDVKDMDPEQRDEMLKALWSIIVAFVDLGFGVHPLQKVQDNNELGGEKSRHSSLKTLECEGILNPDNDD